MTSCKALEKKSGDTVTIYDNTDVKTRKKLRINQWDFSPASAEKGDRLCSKKGGERKNHEGRLLLQRRPSVPRPRLELGTP